MATREDALLEIDGAIEEALHAIGEKVVLFMRQRRRVVQNAIALVFLDEAFLELEQNVYAVIQDMNWAAEAEVEAEVQVTVALANAEQEVWEEIAGVFADGEATHDLEEELEEWDTSVAFLRRLEEIFFSLRESVAEVVEGGASAPTSPSSSDSESSSDGEGGVVLPLLKRRRGQAPS